MATCSASLLTAAAGLDGLEVQQLLAIIACQLATQNGMSCDPQTLMDSAACLTCLTAEQLLAVIACGVSSGAAGGDPVTNLPLNGATPANDGSIPTFFA